MFRLWRELEKAKEMKVPTIYTFVDFSKAFDSLVWARMWEIIEFSGCPTALLAVIRCLHEHATISIRLNSAGDLAAEFKQKKGIRQGSGLSPCLFVLVLDFVLRVYEIACAEVQGLDRTKACMRMLTTLQTGCRRRKANRRPNLKFERERCCSNWRVLPLLWGFW